MKYSAGVQLKDDDGLDPSEPVTGSGPIFQTDERVTIRKPSRLLSGLALIGPSFLVF